MFTLLREFIPNNPCVCSDSLWLSNVYSPKKSLCRGCFFHTWCKTITNDAPLPIESTRLFFLLIIKVKLRRKKMIQGIELPTVSSYHRKTDKQNISNKQAWLYKLITWCVLKLSYFVWSMWICVFMDSSSLRLHYICKSLLQKDVSIKTLPITAQLITDGLLRFSVAPRVQ